MSVEELGDYGVEGMSESEVRAFLSAQNIGVLGLPTEQAPYLLPLSYGYDGDRRLFLAFVLGESSRKEELSRRADGATFLVFTADSTYSWESVLLTGRIEALPESEYEEAADTLTDAWSPDVFERADLSRGVEIYRFEFDEWTGYKHQGLPPMLQE